MVQKAYIFILLLALGVGVASAQSYKDIRPLIKVTGKVISVTDDEPLSGAIVTVKGTNQSVATDNDGSFSIEVPKGATLVISYAGYDKAEVTVCDTTSKIVRLIPAKSKSGWIYCEGKRVPQEPSDTIQPVK
jgi:uncharacterized membrane protein